MAISFDGSNDLINCSSSASLNNIVQSSNGMTVSLWYFPRSAGQGTFGEIFAKGNNDSGKSWNLIHLGATNVVGYQRRFSTSASNLQTASLSGNIFQHICVTDSGTNVATNSHIYRNNVEVVYTTTTNGVGGLVSDSTGAFCIGNVADASTTADGVITEFAIWNTILTADEITQLALSKVKGTPLQVRPTSLVAYWPLDQFSTGVPATGAGSIRDLSNNGNNGTPTNSPTGRAEEILSYQP